MIPDPNTLKRIRAQAESYAAQMTSDAGETFKASRIGTREIIRLAYLAGADAGYAAAKAEERKPCG